MHSDILVDRTAALVTAYVSANSLSATELPSLIGRIHAALSTLVVIPNGDQETITASSEAEIAASIRHDRLVSFLDGKPYKSLKRHLTAHGMTPERYRARFGLPADYPMVSPSYAALRSRIAKQTQLGLQAA